jgi:hypothetical protein
VSGITELILILRLETAKSELNEKESKGNEPLQWKKTRQLVSL